MLGRLTLLVFLSWLHFGATCARAQSTLFLRIESIEGLSTDEQHPGWFDIGSLEFSSGRNLGSVGRENLRTTFSDLTFTKRVDATSPLLAQQAAAGEEGDVELELIRSTTDRRRYYRLRLKNAILSSYSQSAGDELLESITLNFTRLDLTYTEFLTKGGTRETTAWFDVVTQTGGVDNTTGANTAPVVSAIANTNTLEDTAIVIPFTASDAESVSLGFSATTSDPVLLPLANITFGGSGADRTVRLLPGTNQSGVVTVSVIASDSALSTTRTFTLNVTAVNDPPAIAPLINVTDSSTLNAIAGRWTAIQRFQVSDPDSGSNPVALSISANGALSISNGVGLSVSNNGGSTVLIAGPVSALNTMLASSNGLSYRAATGAAGTDLITCTIDDQGASGSGGPRQAQASLPVRIFRNGLHQWQAQHFSEAELGNSALEGSLWGANADPDLDGLENLAEYGLGTNPRSAAHARPAAQLSTGPGGNSYLTLAVAKRRDPDLQLTAMIGSDIVAGTWSGDPATVQQTAPVDLQNGFELIRFTDSTATTTNTRRFLRIRWSLTP